MALFWIVGLWVPWEQPMEAEVTKATKGTTDDLVQAFDYSRGSQPWAVLIFWAR